MYVRVIGSVVIFSVAAVAAAAVPTASDDALAKLAAEDYSHPIRPIGVNGQEAWNVRSCWFKYPPTFGFTNVATASSYRFKVTDEAGRVRTFAGRTANDSLAPVWKDLPVGWATVVCEALDKSGAATVVGTRTFWRDEPYRPGSYPAARRRSYAETAKLVRRYLMRMPIVKALYLSGKPVPKEMVTPENQVFIAYPGKMGAATISAMAALAKSDPSVAQEALALAWGAVRYLATITEPEGAPLAGLPHTYQDHPGLTKHPANMIRQHGGKVMMVYPGEASDAYLDLYALTKDESLKRAAVRIMDRYLALQGEDGTWALNYYLKDGKPVEENRLVPVHVAESFEKLYAVTGDAKYRRAADRALAYIDRGPLSSWNWEGQFEDVGPKGKFIDLTGHNATELSVYLMKRHPGDVKRRSQVREMLRFCEDQFVIWKEPARGKGFDRKGGMPLGSWGFGTWRAPSVLEQYDCYVPVDASVARMVRAYLALYRVEKNPLDLAKAKTLGDSLVRETKDDGYCPTFWFDLVEDWPDCLMDDALALEELEEVTR